MTVWPWLLRSTTQTLFWYIREIRMTCLASSSSSRAEILPARWATSSPVSRQTTIATELSPLARPSAGSTPMP